MKLNLILNFDWKLTFLVLSPMLGCPEVVLEVELDRSPMGFPEVVLEVELDLSPMGSFLSAGSSLDLCPRQAFLSAASSLDLYLYQDIRLS